MKHFIFSVIGLGLVAAQASAGEYALKKVVSGLTRPVFFISSPTEKNTHYILEQDGAIRILKDGKLQKKPFLDIEHKVQSGGERGLLGMAFHPQFAKKKTFYLNYTYKKKQLKTRIAEYDVSAKTGLAIANSEKIILEYEQPYSNHNGGHIEFGPDGYLYIGVGDGGSGGDPHGNGQNLGTLLGAMLRIDINKDPYGIPKDNPFVRHKTARKEIWAYGLRNPWRFSFDRKTGLLYTADVGQHKWEEVDVVEKGKNYGWNVMEGAHCYPPKTKCSTKGLVLPIAEYGRKAGISITGGYVYRGKMLKRLDGYYLYGDYGSGRIWALKYDGKKVVDKKELFNTNLAISSFGLKSNGEIMVVDHDGAIFKIVGQIVGKKRKRQ